jgi:predicted dehydrogenase
MNRFNRREFLGRSAQVGLGWAAGMTVLATATSVRAAPANDGVTLGFIGVGGRGSFLCDGFASRSDCRIAWVADVEPQRAERVAASVARKYPGQRPKVVHDFRKMLDRKDLDAVVIATPEHWHALATIWAVQAGKDVYVEKCVSRHVEEGRKMVEAARKYGRIVQAGTQHRSGPYAAAARRYIKDGKLGEIYYVKVCNMLPSVYGGYPQTKMADVAPPKGFDWDRWLGPAPERPYSAQVHRSWYGYWDFSGGNASDAIHQLDLARMMLGDPPHPNRVQCVGGRWRYADGGQMPDVQIITYQWDKLAMSLENTGFSPVQVKTPTKIPGDAAMPNWLQSSTRIELYGTKGTMYLGRHFLGWQVLVPGSKIAAEQFEQDLTRAHFQNFVDCIRSRRPCNADIAVAHSGACLEHLANISHRLGNRKLVFDPKNERFVGDEEANRHLKAAGRRQYHLPASV